jgi:deoxyribose-phosphate aldolase
MKPLFTVADLERVPEGGDVAVSQETLITPLARDEAERRGITFRMVASRDLEASRGAPGTPSSSEASGGAVAIRAGRGDFELEDQPELEHAVRLVTEEIMRYLGAPGGLPASGLERDDAVCADSDQNCDEKRARKTRAVVHAGADGVSCAPAVVQPDAGFARLIDHTLLKPEGSRDEIRKLCEEARRFGFASVCINPWNVPLAAELLRGTIVKVCAVVGFPLGATLPQVKIHEAEEAIKLGAQEIDMVINIGALKSGQYDVVESDIHGVVEASHRGGAICKVILETALLTVEEKVLASIASKNAGADFVKTSTGFSTAGATAEDVALLRAVVGSEIGVKAAGGVQSFEDLKKMVYAGATRIGASSSVKIMEQAEGSAVRSTAAADAPAAASH